MKTSYDHIAENKRKTWLIAALFPLLFAVLAYVTIIIITAILGDSSAPGQAPQAALPAANQIAMYALPICSAIAIIWILISYYSGDKMLLKSAGAIEIDRQNQPEIFRLVENICIATGMPMPRVYIINDSSLNAFATGRDPQHASVALTKGIVQKLNRTELEGVIAHEMAHISNRDIRLMLITIAGISFFTVVGEILLRSAARSTRGSRNKNSGGAALVILVVAMAFLVYGYFIAPLIRLAMSRNREFLADSTGALTIRNPGALADALEKISQDSKVEILHNRPSMAAMCIESPLDNNGGAFGFLSGLKATHPPIQERIKRLREMDGTLNGNLRR